MIGRLRCRMPVSDLSHMMPKFGPRLQPATPVFTSFQRHVPALDNFGFFPLGDLVFRFVVAADSSASSGHAATELQGLRKPSSSNYFSAMKRQRAQGRRLKARSLGPGR